MNTIEFTGDTLRFLDATPTQAPLPGFIWMHVTQAEWHEHGELVQRAAQHLGGSRVIELHAIDLQNAAHPSHYDFTSVYDLVIFRRLGALQPVSRDAPVQTIHTQAVGFVVFDRLLITVHLEGCAVPKNFIDRFVSDAKTGVDAATARLRMPSSPADLALRMINAMVDSYLEHRKQLTSQLEAWQSQLLAPKGGFTNWKWLLAARTELHTLEDLCEEQRDAMQEWLDAILEQPPPREGGAAEQSLAQAERDLLIARARDVIEHIQRVVHHVRRLEQQAETVVQIHFSAQGNRTNDIMRTLTALTAIFLPLNLIAGIFGMNFEFLPFIHQKEAFWWTLGAMGSVAATLGLVFWRKRYLSRTRG